MTVYLVAQVKVTNDDWVPAYAGAVHDIAARHGGRYLSRSGRITPIEGDAPDTSLVALIEFPTMKALQAFVADPDYAPHAAGRRQGSESVFYAIDDSDIAGGIPYLPAG